MLKRQVYQLLQPANAFFRARKKGLRVLAYHNVPVRDLFEKQLEYLKDNFTIINIELLRDYLFYQRALPDNALLITFDDGDITFLENGLPALQKFQLPAVVFVITGLIDTNRTFWWRQVEIVFKQEGKTYAEARQQVNLLKKVPEAERKAYLQKLPEVESVQLTSQNLEVLIENEILVGNHTHTHPMLNNCSAEEVMEELELAKEKFIRWKIKGYSIFAYPNGNWDEVSENILKQEDIEMAFLFDHKVNKEEIDPLRISRIMVDADLDMSEFKVKVSGMHSELLKLKRKLLR